MQRKFQQSKVHQFIDRLVVPVVSETGTHSAFSKTVETPLVQFLDWFTPVVQRQVQMVQTVQKTVELPQVYFLWLVAFSRREQWRWRQSSSHNCSCAGSAVAVLLRGRCPCCAGSSWRPVLDQVVDVPVVVQRQGFSQWKCLRYSSSPVHVDIPVVQHRRVRRFQQLCLWQR